MARIEEMVVPFALFMIGINLVMMFLSGLPSSVDGSSVYDFGLGSAKKSEIEDSMSRLEHDMNAIGNATSVGVSGGTTEKTQIDILGAMVAGIGLVANAPSLVLNIVNFLALAVFGFVFWIDYFFAPIIGLGMGGAQFVWLAWLLKGILLIVHLIGLTLLLLRVIASFRK